MLPRVLIIEDEPAIADTLIYALKTDGFVPQGWPAGLRSAAPIPEGSGELEFTMALEIDGSGSLMLVPLAEKTTVRLESRWPAPSFCGGYLPTRREVGAGGFSAEWLIGKFGREFPSHWTSLRSVGAPKYGQLEAAAFGVKLAPAVSAYRSIERATKYGLLFVALIFGAFYGFELECRMRLNALNYLLIGGAICLFFLGLLATAELLPFGAAYAIAAGASTALIAGYSWALLKSGRRAVVVGTLLGAIYGYLFLVLGLEDFALLTGTGALFAIVAVLMWLSRRSVANGYSEGPAPL